MKPCVDWIDLARDIDNWLAVMNTVTNARVPQNSENFFTSTGTTTFSRNNAFHEVG